MYQTVGHDALTVYSEALELPLRRKMITGVPLNTKMNYEPVKNGDDCREYDEVEDLYVLLNELKSTYEFEAVSVGAIFSEYQKVRVENVCERLNLKMLAYLWHKDQAELMQEMIQSGVEAILIKVAALGLDPQKHLGKTLKEMYPHLVKMSEKYGLNICGEGGEFESFVLDCPLFKKRIVVDESEVVIHSNDAFAPVGYLKLKKLHLERKID